MAEILLFLKRVPVLLCQNGADLFFFLHYIFISLSLNWSIAKVIIQHIAGLCR